MKEFMEAHGHLPVGDMAVEMKTFITMKKSSKSSSSKGVNGKGRPLSILKNEGYTSEQLANIEKSAEKEWDAVLGSYVYYVDNQERGQNEEESLIKEANFENLPLKRKMKKQATDSSDPDGGKKKKKRKESEGNKGDEKQEGEEGNKKKGKAVIKNKLKSSMASKLAKSKRDAKHIVGNIAVVLAQLTNVNHNFILLASIQL
jgi:hypothetical protein